MEYCDVPGMDLTSRSFLKAKILMAAAKKIKTDHPSGTEPGSSLFTNLSQIINEKLASMTIATNLPASQEVFDDISLFTKQHQETPSHPELLKMHEEVRAERRNLEFRLCFFWRQRAQLNERLHHLEHQINASTGWTNSTSWVNPSGSGSGWGAAENDNSWA